MVKIVWTEASTRDLKQIFDFIAEDSKRYAIITVNQVYHNAQMISDNPMIGRVVPEFNEKSIREVLSGNYRIIYRIKSKLQVDILRVFHTSRLLKKNKLY